jgi:hypothetical protein
LSDILVRVTHCHYSRKYNFKTKRRRLGEGEDDHRVLEESVRTISALFQGEDAVLPSRAADSANDQSLEVRVASISAELAAAIAQAQSRVYDDEDDEDEEDDSGSGQEMSNRETIGPNTSGIRGLGHGEREPGKDSVDGEDDSDSDAFPMPLRHRKGKDPDETALAGAKRKR